MSNSKYSHFEDREMWIFGTGHTLISLVWRYGPLVVKSPTLVKWTPPQRYSAPAVKYSIGILQINFIERGTNFIFTVHQKCVGWILVKIGSHTSVSFKFNGNRFLVWFGLVWRYGPCVFEKYDRRNKWPKWRMWVVWYHMSGIR